MADAKIFYIDTMGTDGKDYYLLKVTATLNADGKTVDFLIENTSGKDTSIQALWFSDGDRDSGLGKTNGEAPPDNVQGMLPGGIAGQDVGFDGEYVVPDKGGLLIKAGEIIPINNVDLGTYITFDALQELGVNIHSGGSKGFGGLASGGDDDAHGHRTEYVIDDPNFAGLSDFSGMVFYFDATSGVNQGLDVKGLIFTSGTGNSGKNGKDNGNGNGNPTPTGDKVPGNSPEGVLTVKVDFATLQKSGAALDDYNAILDALAHQGVDVSQLLGVSFIQSNKLETFYGTNLLHQVSVDPVYTVAENGKLVDVTTIHLSSISNADQIVVDQSIKYADTGDYTTALGTLYAVDPNYMGGQPIPEQYVHTTNTPTLVHDVVQNSYIDQTYSYGDLVHV